ncbi:hypothetical protein GLAREA_02321 [Glarea lozoyensis ATCC 20868]|uniref:DUF8212 domain-containing protein n=1 Tax=Glarea lozoyensis (strain ATCC 20868 / MF5171) TaxID=1116229 RepID=S3DIN0_GLAL2|nr:uncharacterized protein GLAREA_02321 [Glarea lozoyensis ATCC 20868]EPE26408.1 hypothetical protein GLAREA_02321 [Glarea lozoyensis ATCC 20868]
MPLLYGEGANAFIRLQEEIIKVSADHSIFLWDRRFSAGVFLAPHPHHFSSTRRILLYNGIYDFSASPYAISNIGLSMTLPVWSPAPGVLACALACIFEDDARGLIAVTLIEGGRERETLRVRQKKNSKTRSGCSAPRSWRRSNTSSVRLSRRFI